MRALIFIALGASTAGASTLRHSVEVTDNGHSTMTVVVTSHSVEGREVVQPVEIPVGMTATGLTVAICEEPALHSFATDKPTARQEYDDTVAMIKDPALLEYRDARHAMLRVFPVRRGAPAKVTIELTATSLVAAQKLVHVDEHVSVLAAPLRWLADVDVWDEIPYDRYWPVHTD